MPRRLGLWFRSMAAGMLFFASFAWPAGLWFLYRCWSDAHLSKNILGLERPYYLPSFKGRTTAR
jgi:hypothetical protein